MKFKSKSVLLEDPFNKKYLVLNIKFNYQGTLIMEELGLNNYHLLVHLLNLKDQNLPPFKEARTKRINSTKKIINLINVAARTQPVIPSTIFTLNPNNRKSY